jgi:hypothetical protein
VEITKDGRLVAAAFLPLVHAAQRPWMACLNKTEQRQLIDLLDRIQSAPRRSLIYPGGAIPSPPRPSQPAAIELCVV